MAVFVKLRSYDKGRRNRNRHMRGVAELAYALLITDSPGSSPGTLPNINNTELPMLRIVPIPETGYKAIWDTVTDSFWQDANGQQGWDSIDDIDFGNLNDLDRLEFAERIGLLWDNA